MGFPRRNIHRFVQIHIEKIRQNLTQACHTNSLTLLICFDTTNARKLNQGALLQRTSTFPSLSTYHNHFILFGLRFGYKLEILRLIYLENFRDGNLFQIELVPVTHAGAASSTEQQLNPNFQIPLLRYPHRLQLISSWLTFNVETDENKLIEQSGGYD